MQFSPGSIFLYKLFSKTLSLCSSHKVRDQVLRNVYLFVGGLMTAYQVQSYVVSVEMVG